MLKIKGLLQIFSLGFFYLILITCFSSCKKESSQGTQPELLQSIETEIDVQKVEDETGIRFKILKTEVVGYMPLHKFFWVWTEDEKDRPKVEQLAEAIIKEAIAKKPRTYHSFTIHFYCEEDLTGPLDKSKSFAKATYLPEGSWQKVGRVDIGDYQSYVLTCTYLQ